MAILTLDFHHIFFSWKEGGCIPKMGSKPLKGTIQCRPRANASCLSQPMDLQKCHQALLHQCKMNGTSSSSHIGPEALEQAQGRPLLSQLSSAGTEANLYGGKTGGRAVWGVGCVCWSGGQARIRLNPNSCSQEFITN